MKYFCFDKSQHHKKNGDYQVDWKRASIIGTFLAARSHWAVASAAADTLWSAKVICAIAFDIFRWRLDEERCDFIAINSLIHMRCILHANFVERRGGAIRRNKWTSWNKSVYATLTHTHTRIDTNTQFAYCACKLNVWKVFSKIAEQLTDLLCSHYHKSLHRSQLTSAPVHQQDVYN